MLQRTLRILLPLALLFYAGAASAATSADAGFPASSIWASQTQTEAGDSVTIYTVVYNGTAQEIKGVVDFSLDAGRLSEKNFDLAAGTSQIISTDWSATVGTHKVSGSISAALDSTGAPVAIGAAKTGSITIDVSPAPPPPPPSQLQQTANSVSNVVASSTPVVAQTAQQIYNAGEQVRNNTANYFAGQLGSGAQDKGAVLGTSTKKVMAANPGFFGNLWHAIAQIGLTIANSPFLFYPVFFVGFFFILWLLTALFGAMRRGSRSSRRDSY